MRRTPVAVALMCVTFALRAESQVAGSVRDAATSEPVRGAVVVLLGANRELLSRTITSTSGTFRIAIDSAAIIRVIRIGYSPHERRLPASSDTPLVIELTPLGTALRPVAVNSSPVCPQRADQREALALWSSATDALASMVVAPTEAAQTGEVVQLMFDRVVINNGRRIVRQSTHRVVTTNVVPIRAARTPAEFVEHGYVVHRIEASTYYAPDPQVLLDSSFAETHCLSLRRDDRAHPGEIGVEFTPTAGRDSIPDIAGVLWMTRAPMALKSLDFVYHGVDQPLRQVGAGGRLDFETLSSGVPIIRQWQVTSPKLRYFTRGRSPTRTTVGGRPADVEEIHETGGLIADGELEGGTIVSAPLATLGGRVLGPGGGQPVAFAVVSLDSTDHSAVSDGDGRFTLDRVLPGPYTVRATDSALIASVRIDSAGKVYADSGVQQVVTRVATKDIEVLPGIPNTADLSFPVRARVPSCHYDGEADRRFTVLGVLENPAGQPIPHARVELAWADTTRRLSSDAQATFRPWSQPILSVLSTSVETVTNAEGGFVLCGIPGGRPLAARAATSDGGELHGTSRISTGADDTSRRLRNRDVRGVRLVVRRPG